MVSVYWHMYFYRFWCLQSLWRLWYNIFNLSSNLVIKGHVRQWLRTILSFPPNLICMSFLKLLYGNIENCYYEIRELSKKKKKNSYCKINTNCNRSLLQSTSGITKCDGSLSVSALGITRYPKLLLQSASGIKMCDKPLLHSET